MALGVRNGTESLAVASPSDVATSWPTFLYNGQRTAANLLETTLTPENVRNLSSLWMHGGIGTVSGSLAVVNGSAYFGSWDGNLYAVNVFNGSLEWNTSLGGGYDYTGCGTPGIAATPAVWNNTVYIGGSNPWFYAVNATTGAVLWHIDLANVTGASSPWWAYKIWSSALVYGNSVYVGTASGCDTPLVRAALFQIGLANHTIEHVFWTDPPGVIGASIWSSPSVDPSTNTIWATTGNENSGNPPLARAIIALNASNVSELMGYAQEATPGHDFDFGDGATLIKSSTGEPMVVAVNKNGVAYAFNDSGVLANGSSVPRWTLTLTNYSGVEFIPPAYDGQLLYFVGTNVTLVNGTMAGAAVEAVYPDNGTMKWLAPISAPVDAGVTYVNGMIVVGTVNGTVLVLNASAGQTLYSIENTPHIYGEPIVVNGEVLFGFGDIFAAGTPGGVEALALPLESRATAEVVASGPSATFDFEGAGSGGILPYTYSWNFGDGSTGSGALVTHAYSDGGTFYATLSTRDAAGAVSSTELVIQVFSPLEGSSSISPNPAVTGSSVWVNLSLSGGALPYACSWTGLPPHSTDLNLTSCSLRLTPSLPGNYSIRATASSPSGQELTVLFPTLTVNAPLPAPPLVSPPSGGSSLGYVVIGIATVAVGVVGFLFGRQARNRWPPP